MTTKELIRAEIERLKSKYRHNGLWTSSFQSDLAMAKIESMNDLLSFLDSLPDEPVSDCHDLEEAAEKYASEFPFDNEWQSIANNAFIAGAGWMAKQQPLPEDSVAFQKGVQEGKRLMMEGATYNELMELYMAIRDEIAKRHRDAAVNIKEKPWT